MDKVIWLPGKGVVNQAALVAPPEDEKLTVKTQEPSPCLLGVDVCLRQEAAWGEQVRESGQGVLLLWRGGPAAVVVGRSQVIEKEVDQAACRHYGVPILRRISGGGAVLQTSSVLNYSLLLPDRGRLSINTGFRLGTSLVQEALRRLGLDNEVRGVSDVTVNGRKISGNAIARVNRVFLVHGTLLMDMDMPLLEACLRHPSREPDYRAGRSHREFLTTLAEWGVSSLEAIAEAWEEAAQELLNKLKNRKLLQRSF